MNLKARSNRSKLLRGKKVFERGADGTFRLASRGLSRERYLDTLCVFRRL
jgi:hypothetical protein